MVFSHPLFLFAFLPLLLAAYFAIPAHKMQLRNGLLLAASLFFYADGEGAFLLVMLGSVLFNHVIGLRLGAAETAASRRRVLALGVVGNLTLLGVFKYANFAVDSVNAVARGLGGPTLDIPDVHLPVGISFFTFQAMSYVIDVYRGEVPVQRRLRDLALYVSLFPQLIAGPIVRYHDVVDQIRRRRVDRDGFGYGVGRFIMGLAKKMLIANVVGQRADELFALPAQELSTSLSWLAMVCYSLQIYFDFSAYSDMAIGLGHMFGFRFLENFRYPYVSRSITEFWRRWHISLSTWFRDYLYIPLGGNRGSLWQTYRNLVLVFLLCGLWHGASWNYVIWGAYHGAFLVCERIPPFQRLLARGGALSHAYTLFVVLVGWVFFRADTLSQSLHVIATLLGVQAPSELALPLAMYLDAELVLVLACAALGSMPWVPWLAERADGPARQRLALAALALMLTGSVVKIAADSYSPFIYFRF